MFWIALELRNPTMGLIIRLSLMVKKLTDCDREIWQEWVSKYLAVKQANSLCGVSARGWLGKKAWG